MDVTEKIYSYECKKCGKCCCVGLEISIRKEDVFLWREAHKVSFLQHIFIDPKSISVEGLGGFHIEEKNALVDLLKKYSGHYYEMKKKELKDFILSNHNFVGKSVIPLPVYTFIEELGRMPILIPKSFEILLEGIQWGLDYLLLYESSGKCPFLKNNLCDIHEIKPRDCKLFPYNEFGILKIDDYFLKICPGIKKKLKKIK
ncbi:MAG: YkgJ family cysteine cluster protein [Candidatus Lokiarchaeota archaeon]|nr:YkgJ family cysteine cluster protein [Candidatus Lokiarchaeota archaeon]